MYLFLVSLFFLFILEVTYFKIANHYNIIDKPNLRSSHTQITLRGGGIIFPAAFVFGVLIYQPSQIYLAIAVFAIATVSFLDDVLTLNNKLRIGVHLISVLLLLFQIFVNQNILVSNLFNLVSCISILISIIIIIGIINAYNFMDGINGITVLYTLTTLLTIWYLQDYLSFLILNQEVWILIMASLIVFAFFNVRKKAKTFAGDVGSISIALFICFLVFSLILFTHDLKYLLLLGVYGLDAVATIFCRILRKENIFEAHRSHFYQFLANDQKINPILISLMYCLFQILLNLIIIFSSSQYALFAFIFITLIYIGFRLFFEGKQKLFVEY
jgi:UDP-N-acetylmuramyl pentapeptide phosphotransferase/UDP-N-acetylglucosamine-1-phosphate transferase